MNLDENGNDKDHPTYGGNKIPQWYLKKFEPVRPESEGLPRDIRFFTETL